MCLVSMLRYVIIQMCHIHLYIIYIYTTYIHIYIYIHTIEELKKIEENHSSFRASKLLTCLQIHKTAEYQGWNASAVIAKWSHFLVRDISFSIGGSLL